jgi:hypothetical protein
VKVEDKPPMTPQFDVEWGKGKSGVGAVVRFNGRRIENVYAVTVENRGEFAEVWSSKITIELRGESITVHAPQPSEGLDP